MANTSADPTAETKPNILVIITDQLRADHVGFGGHPVVETPNLDALASESLVLEDAHVTNPTCMPSRASLLTGRWPQHHGTRCNGLPLDPDVSTLPRNLAAAGYQTHAVGKLHHQNMGWDFESEQLDQIMLSEPQLLDPTLPDAREPARTSGWDQWEDSQRHQKCHVGMPADYYGYQGVDLVIGHGDRPGGHYLHWARAQGFDPVRNAGWEQALDRHGEHWSQVYTSAVPAELHPSAYVAEQTCNKLEEFAKEDAPFFLFASFPDPHHPFAPPQGYDQLYDPAEIPLPSTFYQDHSQSPKHIQHMESRRGVPPEDPTMTWMATEDQYRAACAAELGLITLIDDQVGRILHTLETTGLADNTIVVFTSDHGDMFGDHGLMLKHFTHYRGVTQVPFTIRVPARYLPQVATRGGVGRSSALVSNADLVPTLLELADVPLHRGIQGQSLVPLLSNTDARLRHAVVVEEDQPFSLDGLPAPVHIRSVITKTSRYTRYFGTDIEELYDLETDPEEQYNLAANPARASLLHEMRALLLDELMALSDHGYRIRAAA